MKNIGNREPTTIKWWMKAWFKTSHGSFLLGLSSGNQTWLAGNSRGSTPELDNVGQYHEFLWEMKQGVC
jgi:hypothetical protein